MIINESNLVHAFNGFKAMFNDASRDEAYGWLGQFPKLREWVGDRVVKDIKAHGFTIANKKFESTLGISREDFADDRYGVFKPMFAEMGHQAKTHPDEMLFELLKNGGTSPCYDGQYYFDTDHPSLDAAGNPVTVSNVDLTGGANPVAWYLLMSS